METVRTRDLVAEMMVLSKAVEIHHRAIQAAQEKADQSAENFQAWFGFYPWECPDYAPGWVSNKAAIEALEEESGYFYACQRVGDIELALKPYSGQLALRTAPTKEWASWKLWTLDGETPKAHPTIWTWLTKTLQGASS